MASSHYSCIIHIREQKRRGGFWQLTSRDLPGLLLFGPNREVLHRDVPNAIKALFKANYDMNISVHQVVDRKAVTEDALEDHHLANSRDWSAVPLAAR